MPIDYRRYAHDWHTRILPEIWRRAKCKCESCGLESRQAVWSERVIRFKGKKKVYRQHWFTSRPPHSHNPGKWVKVILTVAHLDHDEWNHKVELHRLKLLCQRCHLNLDSKIHTMRRQCRNNCNYPTCTTAHCFLNTPSLEVEQVHPPALQMKFLL